ncbi:hypothetical protein SADUNF_Sadunf03G0165600 [Salix dunnii]|uniref:Uncharacterized protein n=1 Tax=Salix dunnii TaxID=1413687 RepID=A0A835TEK8_9ROSI|nr:hypothetical protein SADUNF_Sadunf03G0165600 [Salix dunnii]
MPPFKLMILLSKLVRKHGCFRRLKFEMKGNPRKKIVRADGWHSGINARRIRVNSTNQSGRNNRKAAPLVQDNETIPGLGSETNFRKRKGLLSSIHVEFLMYLNRTFVMDFGVGCYNPDFRFYFDFDQLKEAASIAGEEKWNRSHKKKLPAKKVVAHKMTPLQLRKVKSTIMWRQFDGQEPENYGYRVCMKGGLQSTFRERGMQFGNKKD